MGAVHIKSTTGNAARFKVLKIRTFRRGLHRVCQALQDAADAYVNARSSSGTRWVYRIADIYESKILPDADITYVTCQGDTARLVHGTIE